MPNLATEDLTAIRDLIADYVQPDARRVLVMINAALTVPAPVPGMETMATERANKRIFLEASDEPTAGISRLWTLKAIADIDRLTAEVSRLTGELAEARTKYDTAIGNNVALVRDLAAATAREIAAREEEREWIAELVDHLLEPNEESARVVAAIRSQS